MYSPRSSVVVVVAVLVVVVVAIMMHRSCIGCYCCTKNDTSYSTSMRLLLDSPLLNLLRGARTTTATASNCSRLSDSFVGPPLLRISTASTVISNPPIALIF